jgi:hypothetical protein
VPPKYLYKYRTFNEYSESIFRNHSLRISNPIDFNDPFDGSFNIKVSGIHNYEVMMDLAIRETKVKHKSASDDEIRRIAVERNLPIILENEDYYEDSAMKTFREQLGEFIGLVCLSERFDDITMWGHYSDSHKGFCLRFNTDLDYEFQYARQVKYQEDYTSIEISDLIRKAEDGKGDFEWLFIKSKHWEYEKEWRAAYHDMEYRDRQFPPTALDGVILGCRISPENEAKMRTWVKEYRAPIQLMRAVQSRTKYELKIIGADEDYIPKEPEYE